MAISGLPGLLQVHKPCLPCCKFIAGKVVIRSQEMKEYTHHVRVNLVSVYPNIKIVLFSVGFYCQSVA